MYEESLVQLQIGRARRLDREGLIRCQNEQENQKNRALMDIAYHPALIRMMRVVQNYILCSNPMKSIGSIS